MYTDTKLSEEIRIANNRATLVELEQRVVSTIAEGRDPSIEIPDEELELLEVLHNDKSLEEPDDPIQALAEKHRAEYRVWKNHGHLLGSD